MGEIHIFPVQVQLTHFPPVEDAQITPLDQPPYQEIELPCIALITKCWREAPGAAIPLWSFYECDYYGEHKKRLHDDDSLCSLV